MLRYFRSGGVTQAFVGAIVVAIIIVFVVQFRAGAGPTGGLDQECAVETRSNCVTEKDYLGAYGLIATRGFTPKQVRQLELRRVVLQGLAERELLVDEAARLGVGVSDAEVDAELAKGRFRVSVPAANGALQSTLRLLDGIRFVSVGGSAANPEFDYKIYERQVRNYTNRSAREFKEMQRREMLAARMRDLVRARVQVPEAEIWSEYERDRSKATARVVELRTSWFSKYALTQTDAEVDAWVKEHQAEVDAAFAAAKDSWKEDCPLVSEIRVSFEPGDGDEEKALHRERMSGAEARLRRGERFEGVARAVSDAPSAEVGGHVGCLNENYGAGAETLLKALTTLEPGKVSPVIESVAGLHLVQFHGKLAKADVEKTARTHLGRTLARRAAAKALAERFAAELTKEAKAGKTLEAATEDLVFQYASLKAPAPGVGPKADPKESAAWLDADRPKMEVSSPFSILGSPVPGASSSQGVGAKVFALQKPDELLDASVTTSDGVAVVQLKEKEPARREDFDKDKSRFVGAVRAAKADESLVNYLAQLKRAAGDKFKMNARFAEAPKAQDDGPGDG